MSIEYYINELRRRLNQKRFMQEAVSVLNQPTVRSGAEDGPIVLSMVQHRDVLPYLLALQTFTRQIPPKQVVVVADPTLDEQDQATLKRMVPGIEIRSALEFRHPDLPIGGTWERLHAVTQYAQQGYVIQLDADTVTTGPIDHVADCVAQARPFTLGTFDLQGPVAAAEVARWAQSHCDTHAQPHVQLQCEARLLHACEGNGAQPYIRGCSGFTGWARHTTSPEKTRALSRRMREVLGTVWDKWGTEQYASNLLVSGHPGSTALPHPVYTTPDHINHTTRFIHFIGYLRYYKGIYLQELHEHLANPPQQG